MTAIARTGLWRDAQVIGLIGLAHFLSHFYALALPPLFHLMRQDLAVGYTALGIAVSIYSIATAVLQTPVGLLVDRVGARWVLIAGLAVNAAAIVLAGLAQSYWMLVAAMVLAGAGNSVFHPADYTILSSSIDDKRMGRAFSLHSLGGSLGFAAAPVVVVFLAGLWGWQTALVLSGAAGLGLAAALPLFSGAIRDDRARTRKPDGPPWRSLVSRPILYFFGFFVLSAAAGSGLSTFSVVAFINIYGATQEAAGSVLTLFYLMIAAGVLAGGILADRTRRHDAVLVVTYTGAALCLVAIATGAMPFWLVVVMFCAAGAFRGVVNPSRDLLLRRLAPAGAVGAVFGFVTTGFNIGQGTAPILYGWLMDQGQPSAIFWLAALFTLLTIGIVVVARGDRA